MDNKNYNMINVGEKKSTHRIACAEGTIKMSEEAYHRLKNKDLPKGDVLALAEVAGVVAAKRTSDLIPLCHQIPLNQVEVSSILNDSDSSVTVRCTAKAYAKTGVEMEALQGATSALLSIYDLTKGVCPALTISGVRLRTKEGGKSGFWVHPDVGDGEPQRTKGVVKHDCATALKQMRAAILTISDRVSAGKAEDGSGPIIQKFLKKHGSDIAAFSVVADEVEDITGFITKYTQQEPVDLIITTGGTGVGPRDLTPEALESVCQKMVPGIGEIIRQRGVEETPMASLSRSFGGIAGSTVIIALPGSPAGVSQGLVAIHDILPHMVSIARGGGHE